MQLAVPTQQQWQQNTSWCFTYRPPWERWRCVALLRCLSSAYPEARLTLVTTARFVPLFEELPQVAFVTPELYGKHKGLSGLYQLVKTLKKLRPTHIADLHQSFSYTNAPHFFSTVYTHQKNRN